MEKGLTTRKIRGTGWMNGWIMDLFRLKVVLIQFVENLNVVKNIHQIELIIFWTHEWNGIILYEILRGGGGG